MLSGWQSWWATPLVGLSGGYLASLISWPLPWIIGSLLAVIAARCSGWLITELPGGRKTGQWLVSSAIGLHFTHEVFGQLLSHFGVILLGALLTLLLSLIGIIVLRRAGLDRATAFFASMPGGASEMVNLAQRHNAETAKVAAAQAKPADTAAEKAANVAEARKDATAEKNEANYKAAKERCDAMSGDLKSKCVDDAKRMYGQS